MTRAIVFGANGQLGKCFKDISLQNSEVDYRFYGRSQFDIADIDAYQILESSEIDVIINCAAYTQVDKAESDREQAYRNNVEGPGMMGRYGAEHDIPVFHISTDYIFAPATKPIQETHPVAPVNYYGLTKWKGEEAIRQSGVKYMIFRTSWLYSEYGHNFVKTMLRLADSHPEIKVVDDQTGSPTYARDLAESIDGVISGLDHVDLSNWRTYHLANKGSVTWYEFACEILKDKSVTVRPIPSESYPTPAARPRYSVLDTTLFEKTFDVDLPDWKDGLRRCLNRL